MENYIKYKRTVEKILIDEHFEKNLQHFLDGLIQEGFQILYYNEEIKRIINQVGLEDITVNTLHITVLIGKIRPVL